MLFCESPEENKKCKIRTNIAFYFCACIQIEKNSLESATICMVQLYPL